MDRHTLVPSGRFSAYLLLAGLSGIVFSGCQIADPALPSFTTRLTIPLGDKRIDIIDIIEDEDYLIALDDTLGFSISGAPKTVVFDFDLGADVQPLAIAGEIGAFALELDSGASFDFALGDIWTDAEVLHGSSGPVPPFPILVESRAEELSDVASARLESGTVTVTVANGLPVPISSGEPGPDRLLLDLLDPDTGTVLASLEFDMIESAAHAQRSADLSGIALASRIALRLAGGSPGSQTDVMIDARAEIAVDLMFSGLEASEAVAIVPSQSFETAFTSPLPEDYGVMLAEIEGGSITVTLRNEMPIPCHTVLSWPAVRDPEQRVLELSVSLPAGSETVREIDFAGHVIAAPEGELLGELAATLAVTSAGSGASAVALRADHGVLVDIAGARISFSSVTGTIPRMRHEIDLDHQEIDLPEQLEGLELLRASMVIELICDLVSTATNTDFVTFDLLGINQNGVNSALRVQESIEAPEVGQRNAVRIEISEQNSSIVEFLNHMPVSISLAGRIELGGCDAVRTFARQDQAVIGWQITAPVEVVIQSTQLFSETAPLGLDESTRSAIEDHLETAQVQFEILNHLPVGVSVRWLLGTDPLLLRTEPLLAIGPVTAQAGYLASGGFNVVEARLSRPCIAIGAYETGLLATEGLHSLVEISLPSTEGSPVRVMTNDFIAVQGFVSLEIDVTRQR